MASLRALPPAALRQLAAMPDAPLRPPPSATPPATGPAELSEEEIDVGD